MIGGSGDDHTPCQRGAYLDGCVVFHIGPTPDEHDPAKHSVACHSYWHLMIGPLVERLADLSVSAAWFLGNLGLSG